ncbi:MAG: gliding motility-associated ABC transporter ATP-binding subunit GldA, partial [Schleiferiaceae bacterium]|nr:gliding motility-associated ABC transporter ATP-binding subunit GldA [Schleiferiaceae bacterium]
MSIEVKNITKLYGNQKALNNVSFSLKKGEVVGFLGPNGAGKSTMMKILTGYIPQSEGEAIVTGHDVTTNILEVQQTVGYLPEHNPQYLDMYVKEYLSFVAGTYKAPKQRVDEVIEQTGITPEKSKKIGQLSKGYRQRIGLAAALIHNPEVLILDEPTTGLDPNQLVQIRGLIKEVGKEKTVLLSTHIMQEVEEMCSRVIIINKGEIVLDSPTEELGKRAKSTLVIVEFDKEADPALLRKIKGTKSVTQIGRQFEITTNGNEDIRPLVFEFAVEHQLKVLEISQQEQN